MENQIKPNVHLKYLNDTKNYYNEKFGQSHLKSLNHEESLRWRKIKAAIEGFKNGKKLDILDFGCGNGRFSGLLQNYGTVCGVDIAPQAIHTAQSFFPNINFYVGDVSAQNIVHQITDKFDVIVSSEVIEHLINQDNYLENAYKLLKKDSYLVMTTPNKRWFNQYFDTKIPSSQQPVENWLSMNELSQKLETAGFEILEKDVFRTDWLFFAPTKGFLKCIGNKYVRKCIQILKVEKTFHRLAERLGLGIYLFIIAKK